jgi:hypothetical protein
MRWGIPAFLLLIALVFSTSAVFGWVHGVPPPASTPPCDIVTCAEAHSITRAMTASYHGPLFQITKSGGATLDIGQVNGVADMSTWSAFCGGVQSNCWYFKVYAQIHTTSNDLTSSKGLAQSSAPFQIEAATGLPIAVAQATTPFNIFVAGADTNATGINGGGAAVSVYVVGKFTVTTAQCCGVYGIYHLGTAPDTPGTDFGIMPTYDNSGFSHCTALTYCLQIDEEQNDDGGDVGSSAINLIGVVTFDPTGSTTAAGYTNNHASFSHSPPSIALNPGIAIHMFVGGDLTQNGNQTFREGMITNSTLTPTQVATLTTNAKLFYSGISFP